MIETSTFWVCVVAIALGTLVIRFSVIALSGRIVITDRHRELFTYIPASIFPALVVPLVFFHEGVVTWLAGKERLVIIVLAVIVSLFIRSMMLTLVFGLLALYVLTQVA
ncbi:MAG: AzlD domain-containing protein [Bdellovibrionota bacterium]